MEGYELEDSYGNVIHFLPHEVVLRNKTGYGTAPIRYSSTSGFLQDGETVQRFNLNSRTLTLDIYISDSKFQTKDEYWDYRNSLLSILNPFAAPLTFTVTRLDGSKRQLTNIYPNSGIGFVNETSWNIQETITLSCNTPYWINPTEDSFNFSSSVDADLIFPIDFPIFFGSIGETFSKTFASNEIGTWKIYPTIIINGAYNTCTITNGWNNAVIQLFIPITGSEQRVINLNPSELSIVDSSGNNKIGELSNTSNLVDFYLHPNETNSISAVLTTTDGNTSFNIAYNKTYIGI